MYKNKRPYKPNYVPDSLKKIPKITPYTQKYIPTNKEKIKKTEEISIINNTLLEKPKTREETFNEKLKLYESTPLKYFVPETNDLDDLLYVRNFLYHGLRFQKHLEKLESIFKNKAILAGNYQDNQYYSYSENCNEGEYISLTCIEEDYDLIYRTFIMPNISLVISSECKAIKTIYLSYEEWEKIKTIETKKRYSYANNEYQVKQIIPINMIKAIGLPSRYLRLTNQEYLIDIYKNDILELMNKYNIELPIVDTSNYNNLIYLPKEHISNHTLKRVK